MGKYLRTENGYEERTHWREGKITVLVDNLTSEDYHDGNYPSCNFIPGQVYNVTFNGDLYEGLICYFDGWNIIATTENYPFYIDDGGGDNLWIEAEEPYTISITEGTEIYHKIDEKYLPNSIIDAFQTKMDKDNPTGTGSFSMNRLYGSKIGDCSHAEGSNATASGDCSHAEGDKTIAAGSKSHAEGSNATASGDCSHAEGDSTIAAGSNSHAEGSGTSYYIYVTGEANSKTYKLSNNINTSRINVGCAIRYNNKTTRITQYDPETSTIETLSTLSNINLNNTSVTAYTTCATGSNSHVEGLDTIAASDFQHVQGKCNITDDVQKYAHIVGNGASKINRSNAHTLDWDGNAWFAGDVYVGSTSGTNKDEGSQKLITEKDAKKIVYNCIYLADTENNHVYKLEMKNGTLTTSFDTERILQDFTYATSEDGIHTITGWKETLNGESSTELIVPETTLIDIEI